jgi:hypothetical protein
MTKLLLSMSLIVSALLFGNIANAAEDYSIEASGYIINSDLRLVEICGKVTGPTVDGLRVELIADPGKYQGHYMTSTSPSGRFCKVLRIQTNRYIARLLVGEKSISLKSTAK